MSLRVVASSPTLELSGANVLVANLLDRLEEAGLETAWIVTGHNPGDDAAWLGERRFKIHRLPPTKAADVRQRQKRILDFLAEHSPCVYLPNFDFDMACAIPALPPASPAVLIMHCDDPVYYNFAARHGTLFNGIVCVSDLLAKKLRAAQPDLRDRIVHIPFGVEPPAQLPLRKIRPGQPLNVVYCGRISFHQKRVQDLAQIINRCHAENLPVRFQIAGTGPDEKAFYESISGSLAAGKVARLGLLSNPEVLQLLGGSDVLVMTSDFEGLPVVLLEAMSRGCVPVATRIESGMGEVIQDGVSGFLLAIGDVKSFCETLAKLSADPGLRQRMQQAAYDRIRSGSYTLERAAADYRKLFESLHETRWQTVRNGRAIIPNHYRLASRLKKKAQTFLQRF